MRCTRIYTQRTQCHVWKTHFNFRVCVLVVGESNSQMVSLTDELSQKNEELLRHQEEIAQLLSQIVELQHRVKEVRRDGSTVTDSCMHNVPECELGSHDLDLAQTRVMNLMTIIKMIPLS